MYVYAVAEPSSSMTTSLFVPSFSERTSLSSQMKDMCILSTTFGNNDVLRQHLYQHLSAGHQLPTAWYNAVMKKSIIDPRFNFNKEYDLPTMPSCVERKEVPETSTSVTPVEDPTPGEITDKMVLPHLVTIRRKKMKKHKRKKLIKRMRFVLRRRRQLKEKRKERAIQQYEREQAKLGQLYNAEQCIDEQLALARKSGWHIDIIAEFNREKEKDKAAAASSVAASSSSSEK